MTTEKPEPAKFGGTEDHLLTPVMPDGRIPSLDILRGFALFGVLWSNLNHYDPTSLTGLDETLSWIQQWLIQNRFYSLLGFLFGIGFAIQLDRAESLSRDVRKMFYRRMFVLLLFGIAHGMFVWSGDILTRFALIGCLLPFYRRLSPRGLLISAGATWVGAAYLYAFAFPLLNDILPQLNDLPNSASVYANGTYQQVMSVRATEYLRDARGLVVFFGNDGAQFLTLFILGLWAERTSLVSRISDRLGWIRRALWVALACVGAGLVLAAGFSRWWPAPAPPPPPGGLLPWFTHRFVSGIPSTLMTWGTAGAYAAALTLLAHRVRWVVPLRPLAAAGRMSLTTYLSQSVISTMSFYGYGLGWYGQVSYSGMLAIALIVFGCQLVFSAWWLRRYRFGPAEWLWRSMSYGKAQPMRLKTAG